MGKAYVMSEAVGEPLALILIMGGWVTTLGLVLPKPVGRLRDSMGMRHVSERTTRWRILLAGWPVTPLCGVAFYLWLR